MSRFSLRISITISPGVELERISLRNHDCYGKQARTVINTYVQVCGSSIVTIRMKVGTDESLNQLATERTIYDRLGSNPYITKVLSIHKDMLVLERLQYPLRKWLRDLRDAEQLPAPKDIMRWAAQIAQALEHAHLCGVLQVDIGSHNVPLDWAENVKLTDFAGSSIDGSAPSVLPSAHSEHPSMLATKPSLQSEIFALGFTIYELETTRQPYYDRTDTEIERLFSVQDFPDTSALVLREVVTKCWKARVSCQD